MDVAVVMIIKMIISVSKISKLNLFSNVEFPKILALKMLRALNARLSLSLSSRIVRKKN